MKRKTEKLSWRQEIGLVYLIQEASVEGASRASGISHATYWRWMRDPKFKARYDGLTDGILAVAVKGLEANVPLAVNTLREVMEDKTAPAGSRAAAARTVLEMVTRQRELEDIDRRLVELERLAMTRTGRRLGVA